MNMTVATSLMVALFCMATVFALLACVYALVRLVSLAVRALERRRAVKLPEPVAQFAAPARQEEDTIAAGTLRLVNVDEPTAAMIMAIVSDESGIPLSELRFKSIRLLPSEKTGQE